MVPLDFLCLGCICEDSVSKGDFNHDEGVKMNWLYDWYSNLYISSYRHNAHSVKCADRPEAANVITFKIALHVILRHVCDALARKDRRNNINSNKYHRLVLYSTLLWLLQLSQRNLTSSMALLR